jgi:hypothetical protein
MHNDMCSRVVEHRALCACICAVVSDFKQAISYKPFAVLKEHTEKGEVVCAVERRDMQMRGELRFNTTYSSPRH